MLRAMSDSSTPCSTPTDFNKSSLQKARLEWPLKFVTQCGSRKCVCVLCFGCVFNECAANLVVFWDLILLCRFNRHMRAGGYRTLNVNLWEFCRQTLCM